MRSLRQLSGQINWAVSQVRPDCAFNGCFVSTSTKNSTINDLVYANKTVKKIKSIDVPLVFSHLGDVSKAKILCFSDASFNNLRDGGSQCGVLIFIMGENGRTALVEWHSKRIKRIVKSTIGAECLAAVEAVEHGMLIGSILKESLKITYLPMLLFCDNKSLVEASHSTTSVSDKRLRVDIALLRELISNSELSEMKWIPTDKQIANVLKKQGAPFDKLIKIVTSGAKFDLGTMEFSQY